MLPGYNCFTCEPRFFSQGSTFHRTSGNEKAACRQLHNIMLEFFKRSFLPTNQKRYFLLKFVVHYKPIISPDTHTAKHSLSPQQLLSYVSLHNATEGWSVLGKDTEPHRCVCVWVCMNGHWAGSSSSLAPCMVILCHQRVNGEDVAAWRWLWLGEGKKSHFKHARVSKDHIWGKHFELNWFALHIGFPVSDAPAVCSMKVVSQASCDCFLSSSLLNQSYCR